MKRLAAVVLCLTGACADAPPPFTYELSVSHDVTPGVAINGDPNFEHQIWEFESYAEARDTFVLDMTYGSPPQHGEVRAEGCALEGHGSPPHDLDRLTSQRVQLGAMPTWYISLWCQTDSGESWGAIQ